MKAAGTGGHGHNFCPRAGLQAQIFLTDITRAYTCLMISSKHFSILFWFSQTVEIYCVCICLVLSSAYQQKLQLLYVIIITIIVIVIKNKLTSSKANLIRTTRVR